MSVLPSLVLALAASAAATPAVAGDVDGSGAEAVNIDGDPTPATNEPMTSEEMTSEEMTSVEQATASTAETTKTEEEEETTASLELDFDFDLLGDPEPVAPLVDDSLLTRRRALLSVHQGLGLALVATMAGTLISGQLNFHDNHRGDETGRFELSHRVLSYSALGLFAVTGGAALVAPVPADRVSTGIDRVMLHRIGLFGATAGMVAQAILGPITAGRQGYLDQEPLAVAHLAVGWTTLALMAMGVGALVF